MKPNWPVALSLFAAALASYAIYYHFSEPLKALAGDLQILDMRDSGYTLVEALQLLEYLGEDGRTLYGRTTLLDTLWPALLGISSIFMAALSFRTRWLIIIAAFFPVAFGILDAMENVGILVILGSYPDISNFWVDYCVSITRLKWAVIPAAFTIFLTLPLLALVRLLVTRWQQAKTNI